MLTRILSRRYVFTASGDIGEVSVYDHAGRRLVGGLYSAAAAERWCDEHTATLPLREPRARPVDPPTGRSRVTGY
jgi:hypothetical protein